MNACTDNNHLTHYPCATLALFLEIEKVFDKVWITGLISKLKMEGIAAISI
jgi:hypothetical protein